MRSDMSNQVCFRLNVSMTPHASAHFPQSSQGPDRQGLAGRETFRGGLFFVAHDASFYCPPPPSSSTASTSCHDTSRHDSLQRRPVDWSYRLTRGTEPPLFCRVDNTTRPGTRVLYVYPCGAYNGGKTDAQVLGSTEVKLMFRDYAFGKVARPLESVSYDLVQFVESCCSTNTDGRIGLQCPSFAKCVLSCAKKRNEYDQISQLQYRCTSTSDLQCIKFSDSYTQGFAQQFLKFNV